MGLGGHSAEEQRVYERASAVSRPILGGWLGYSQKSVFHCLSSVLAPVRVVVLLTTDDGIAARKTLFFLSGHRICPACMQEDVQPRRRVEEGRSTDSIAGDGKTRADCSPARFIA